MCAESIIEFFLRGTVQEKKRTDTMHYVNSIVAQGNGCSRVSVSNVGINNCQSFRTLRVKNAGLFLPGS